MSVTDMGMDRGRRSATTLHFVQGILGQYIYTIQLV